MVYPAKKIMNLIITGKDFALTEGIKNVINEKLKKVEKLIGEDSTIEVKLGARGNSPEHYKVELTVRFKKNIVRAEVMGKDMYNAIGEAVDTVTTRIRKLKGKRKKKAGEKSIRDNSVEYKNIEEMDLKALHQIYGNVLREKEIAAEAMTRDEACVEMEYTDHDFYVFKDAERDEKMSLLYKRKTGGYGILVLA